MYIFFIFKRYFALFFNINRLASMPIITLLGRKIYFAKTDVVIRNKNIRQKLSYKISPLD